MYGSDEFKQLDNETFALKINTNRAYKILQLTDMHLGFGIFSKKKDRLALKAVSQIIKRTKPDLIVITGDSVFPFFPKAGTMNNKRQAEIFIRFMDSFGIPYALVYGNHDCEMFARYNKDKLSDVYSSGKYSIFTKGRKDIYGMGNYFINLTDSDGKVILPLVFLDSNMYGEGGWFYSGFDCIHEDQVDWCMDKLSKLKKENSDVRAMAFFHIPVNEFKEAYEKMKMGDKAVVYKHGNIGEADDHFGIPKFEGTFFNRAVDNGIIKWMFCGHDHLNTLSLTYKGIRLTYGMSIDCLGYNGISKSYIQRGGTLITRKIDGRVDIKMVPLTRTVSTRVRGESKNQQY